jgi:cytochrome b-561
MSTPIEIIDSNDPVAVPWRVALVRPDMRPEVRESEERYVMTFPHLIVREIILFQLVVIGLSLAAILFDAPLESIANPLETPNPAKAPWYFLWLQEIVTDTTLHIGSLTINGAFIGGVVLPGLIVGLLTVWPWLDRSPRIAAGAWFPQSRRGQNIAFLVLTLVVILLTLVGTFCRGPYWRFYWPWQAWPEIPTRL